MVICICGMWNSVYFKQLRNYGRWLVLYSLGQHLVMPVTPSIGMSLSKSTNYGSRLSTYSAFVLFATLFGYGIVWIGFKFLKMTYNSAFVICAVMYCCAALIFGMMKKSKAKLKKPKFVFRKKYMLFYALSAVNGGRKQIFMPFAPWVLIQVYHLDAPVFAVFGLIISVMSIGSRKIAGWAIDNLGEVRLTLSVIPFRYLLRCTLLGDFLSSGLAIVIMAAVTYRQFNERC